MNYFLIACLILLTEYLYIKVAAKKHIIDRPNNRSSHTSDTLSGGGIVFYFSVLFYFIMYGFQYPWFFAGLTLITLISFADDIKPQSSRLRLILHYIAMALMFCQLGVFGMPWYLMIISILFFTGILNAFNFMDGINGITSGYSMVVIMSLWYINNHVAVFIKNDFLYILMIALAVFSFFNFRKQAKCFAGDVGALSIAFIIIFLISLLIIKTQKIYFIFLLSLYGVDTVLTIIHRIVLHENILKPHRKHMYQIMANELHIPHLFVSLIYMVLQAFISCGLLLTKHPNWFSLLVILFLSLVYILFMKRYYKLSECQIQKK